MKFILLKELLQEKLSIALRFSLSKTSSIPSLQGGMLKLDKSELEIITTNLNDFFYTKIKTSTVEEKTIALDIKKIVEFLSFLTPGRIEVEIKDNFFSIKNEKTRGVFRLIPTDDFPTISISEGKEYSLESGFIEKTFPSILFAAAKDEARPILTGVNFSVKNGVRYIASTDGFRLSLVKSTEKRDFPSVTISANVLGEVLKLSEDKEDNKVVISFSEKEKMTVFKVGDNKIFSRVIEGDFPPFEKIIPTEYKTKIILDKEEFLRNIKLSSIFARDFSNIIVFEIKKDGLYIKPKTKEEVGTTTHQEGEFDGEEQRIAFNYKFILDFLNNTKGKEVIFEMTTSNSPGVFKIEEDKDFTHIIMPVRTEEETS